MAQTQAAFIPKQIGYNPMVRQKKSCAGSQQGLSGINSLLFLSFHPVTPPHR